MFRTGDERKRREKSVGIGKSSHLQTRIDWIRVRSGYVRSGYISKVRLVKVMQARLG